MNQNKKLGFWDDRVSKGTSEGVRFIVALLGGGISLGLWVKTNYNVVWFAIFLACLSYLIVLVIQNRNTTQNEVGKLS